jgi:hypothetical protein
MTWEGVLELRSELGTDKLVFDSDQHFDNVRPKLFGALGRKEIRLVAVKAQHQSGLHAIELELIFEAKQAPQILRLLFVPEAKRAITGAVGYESNLMIAPEMEGPHDLRRRASGGYQPHVFRMIADASIPLSVP